MSRGFGATLGVGDSDQITTAYATDATQRSIAVRFKRNGIGGPSDFGFGHILDKRSASVTQRTEVLFYNTSGGVLDLTYERAWSGGNVQWRLEGTGDATAEHNLVIAYDGISTANIPSCWLDGAAITVSQIGGTSPSGSLITNAANYVLGNRGTDSQRNWDGWLAEFALIDGIATAADAASYNAGFAARSIWASRVVAELPLIRDVIDLRNGAPTATGTAVQPHPRVIYPGRAANRNKVQSGGANAGTGSVAVDGLAASASGVQKSRGAAAAVVDGLAAAAVGRTRAIGAAAALADGIGVSGVGVQRLRGSGSVPVDGIAASGSEAAIRVGVGAVAVDGIAAASSGVHKLFGSVAVVVDGIGLGSVGRVRLSAQGALAVDGVVVAGLGRLRIIGAGAVAIDGIAASASEVSPTVYGRGMYSGGQSRRNRASNSKAARGAMSSGQGRLGFYNGGAA